MDPAARYEPSPSVVTREVGDETMLVDLASGTYYGLNAVGGQLWQELEAGRTVGEACDHLAERFDVSRDVLNQDVAALLGELVERGLVVVV